MIRDITLGQYYPGNSVIHKLDPRIKIMATLLYIVALFVVKDFLGFIAPFGRRYAGQNEHRFQQHKGRDVSEKIFHDKKRHNVQQRCQDLDSRIQPVDHGIPRIKLS